jgi:hypothetical protein
MRTIILLCLLIFSFLKVHGQQFPLRIGQAQDATNINSQDGNNYQHLKRSIAFFLPDKEINSFSNNPCSATFVNTTDQEKDKIYLLTATGCILKTNEKATDEGYISFDFEMSEEDRVGNSQDDAFISKLYETKYKVLVKGQSVSLIELKDFDPKILDYAYTAGWNNGLDDLTYSNISHPYNDHKKLYFNPEVLKLRSYNFENGGDQYRGIAYVSESEANFGIFWGSNYKTRWNNRLTDLYRGAHGSGHFDKEQSVRAVTVARIRYDHLANVFYNRYGAPGIIQEGLKTFLDKNNTWLNHIPGGYYKDRVTTNINGDIESKFQLTLAPGEEQTTNVSFDEGILYDDLLDGSVQRIHPDFLFTNLSVLESNVNLARAPWATLNGINAHQLNGATVAMNIYYIDYNRGTGSYEERLLYGVIVDNTTEDVLLNGAVHPEYNFKGRGYDCGATFTEVGQPCNRISSIGQPVQRFSDRYQSESLKAVYNQSKSDGRIRLISNTFIPVVVKLKNIGASPAVINAIAYPGDVPKNALQLFKPQEVLDQFSSYSYPPLQYNSQNLHIASIDVFQDGEHTSPLGDNLNQAGEDYNYSISTKNNGGYLNLKNRNYLIGPIEVSSSEDAIDQSTFEVKINPNAQSTTYSYSIWIDYYKDFANGGYDFIPDVDANLGFGTTSELVGSGTSQNGGPVTVSIDLPSYNNMFMSNGLFGETTMRVAIKGGTAIPNKNDIGGIGEVEDYLIKFTIPREVLEERDRLREDSKIWHNQGDKTQDPTDPNANPDQTPLHDSTDNPFTYGTFGGTCENDGTCENIYIDTENAMEQNKGECYNLTGENIIYLDNTKQVINTNSFSDRTISFFYKEDSVLPTEDRREILYQSGDPDGGGGDDFIIIATGQDGLPEVHARIDNEIIDMTKEVVDRPESVDEWLWNHATLVFKAGLLELYYNGNKIAERNTTATVVQHNGVATVGGSDTILNSAGLQKSFATDSEHVYGNYSGYVDHVIIDDIAHSAENVTLLSIHHTQIANANTTQTSNFRGTTTAATDTNSNVEEVQLPYFSIYPNPASNMVNVLVEVEQRGSLQVEIFDLNARRVYAMSRKTIEAGHQYIQLQNLNLANGNYILRIKAGNVMRSEKIIIQR